MGKYHAEYRMQQPPQLAYFCGFRRGGWDGQDARRKLTPWGLEHRSLRGGSNGSVGKGHLAGIPQAQGVPLIALAEPVGFLC